MPQQRLKGVFFDMDGLLIDSERLTREACKYAGGECGVGFTDEFYGTLIGKSDDESKRAVLERFGTNFPFDTFMTLVSSKMKELLQHGDLFKKGAREIVQYVDDIKIPTALVTSSHHNDVHERIGEMIGYFSTVVARDDVQRGKPAPDLYIEGISRLGLNPDECIVFEDSPVGAEAALQAGLNVVIVPDLIKPGNEIKNKVSAICEDLFEALDYLKYKIDEIY